MAGPVQARLADLVGRVTDVRPARRVQAGDPSAGYDATMTTPHAAFAVLLEAPDPVSADLAKNLLEQAGIPSLLHGPDQDMAELGVAHAALARPDLVVPREALERAQELLQAAWGDAAPDGDGSSTTDGDGDEAR